MVTPSKREVMGSQGMVDTVMSPDMVAACPDWERNIQSEAQWVAKNFMQRTVDFLSF